MEAAFRKLEQAHKDQLNGVHRQSVILLRNINRFKNAITNLLEKELLTKAADEVRKLPDINTDEVGNLKLCVKPFSLTPH